MQKVESTSRSVSKNGRRSKKQKVESTSRSVSKVEEEVERRKQKVQVEV